MAMGEKELVLTNIREVTNGIIKDIGINNSFSSWKNTEIGLRFIKEDTTKFNLGIKLWLEIVEQQILSEEIWQIIDSCPLIGSNILEKYCWLNNLKDIKEYSKQVNN
jgi:hypothetical protein